jgi:taspase (threonine aspartase 1)
MYQEVMNPIMVAAAIRDQALKGPLSCGRLAPNALTGEGAVEFASAWGLPLLPLDANISDPSRQRWKQWAKDLNETDGRLTIHYSNNATLDDRMQRVVNTNKMRVKHVKLMLQNTPAFVSFEEEQNNYIQRQAQGIQQPRSPTSTPMEVGSPRGTSPEPKIPEMVDGSNEGVDSSRAIKNGTVLQTQYDSVHNRNDPKFPSDANGNTHNTVFNFDTMEGLLTWANNGLPVEMNRATEQYLTSAALNHTLSRNASEQETDMDCDTRMAMDYATSYLWFQDDRTLTQEDDLSESQTLNDQDTGVGHLLEAANRRLRGLRVSEAQNHVDMTGNAWKTLTPMITSPEEDSYTPLGTPPRECYTTNEHVDQDWDEINDTVGVIIIDRAGNLACGSSSGGLGMKMRGRAGPAGLPGAGSAVIPADPDDPEGTTVAVVASGTGEYINSTMAATMAAERVYYGVKKVAGGTLEECGDGEALEAFIAKEFLGKSLKTQFTLPKTQA